MCEKLVITDLSSYMFLYNNLLKKNVLNRLILEIKPFWNKQIFFLMKLKKKLKKFGPP